MKANDLLKAPKGNWVAWVTLIAAMITIVLMYDKYYGYGDFFGLAKPKTRDNSNKEA